MLTSIKNQEILVELKNGETVYGKLTNCDSWMNLTLSDVIFNYNNGEKFTKMNETYIRGIHIKSLRLPDSVCIECPRTPLYSNFTNNVKVMDHAKEQNMLNMEQRNRNQKRRGGFQRRNDGGREYGRNHNGNFRGNGRRNYNGN